MLFSLPYFYLEDCSLPRLSWVAGIFRAGSTPPVRCSCPSTIGLLFYLRLPLLKQDAAFSCATDRTASWLATGGVPLCHNAVSSALWRSTDFATRLPAIFSSGQGQVSASLGRDLSDAAIPSLTGHHCPDHSFAGVPSYHILRQSGAYSVLIVRYQAPVLVTVGGGLVAKRWFCGHSVAFPCASLLSLTISQKRALILERLMGRLGVRYIAELPRKYQKKYQLVTKIRW